MKNQRRLIKRGFLPLLLPILGALGALGGGAAGIAKAVNHAKANTQRLEEQKDTTYPCNKQFAGKV